MYAMIAQNGDAEAVRSYLDGLGAQVTLSDSNFAEVMRAPVDVRSERCRVFKAVANGINKHPNGYLDSKELLSEILRCRPDWLKKRPNLRQAHTFQFSRNDEFWRQLPYLSDPSNEFELEGYQELTYEGAGRVASGQKYNRKVNLENTPISFVSPDPDLNRIYQSMEYIEQLWRVLTATAWIQSLWGRNEINRDWRDFSLPYLNMEVITAKDFELMWLQCVEKHRVPRNYVQTRTQILQEDYRITTGNAMDTQHAVGMLGFNWFITTDKTFFEILKSIESDLRNWPRNIRNRIRPIFIPILGDRSNPDTVSSIKCHLKI